MNNNKYIISYNILSAVRSGGYSNIELNEFLKGVSNEDDKRFVTFLVYGVLDKDITLDFILDKLLAKKPKAYAITLLKMGIFLLRFSNVPQYAAVNNIVDTAKKLGKQGISGFINAVLKNSQNIKLYEDSSNTAMYLSINFSYPLWIVERVIGQYGEQFARDFFSYSADKRTHIRANLNKTTRAEFEDILNKIEPIIPKNRSILEYYATWNTMNRLPKGLFTPQSLGSMLVVECFGRNRSGLALDVCSAPGGKAVYFRQNNPDCKVVACDIHAHRVALIEQYAKSMGCSLEAMQCDGTILNKDFVERFDIVMCDVPCSGMGIVSGKPELKLNAKQSNQSLLSLQRDILSTASRYVKAGGELLYSTCTILKEENEQNVEAFLKQNQSFTLCSVDSDFVKSDSDGYVRIFPHTHNTDGFFAALLKKREQ